MSQHKPDYFWPAATVAAVSAPTTADHNAWRGQLPQVEKLGSLLTRRLKPRIPLIEPWLHSGESCLLWGGTGCGKSMISMTLALGMAGGGEALGWSFPNPGRVLFVDGEQSLHDVRERFATLGSTLGPTWNAGLANDNLMLMARTNQKPGAVFLDIAKPEQVPALVAATKASGVVAVVFDNLSTLSETIKDENSAGEFKTTQALLAQLKSEGVAAIAVHHAGKDATKFRGSSNIATTFERILGLLPMDNTPDPARLHTHVQLQKFRGKAPPGFLTEFPLELKTDPSGNLVWELGDFAQLRTAWRLFDAHDATFTDSQTFLALIRDQTGLEVSPKNLARDLYHKWERKLGLAKEDIEAAKGRMRERAEEAAEAEGAF